MNIESLDLLAAKVEKAVKTIKILQAEKKELSATIEVMEEEISQKNLEIESLQSSLNTLSSNQSMAAEKLQNVLTSLDELDLIQVDEQKPENEQSELFGEDFDYETSPEQSPVLEVDEVEDVATDGVASEEVEFTNLEEENK